MPASEQGSIPASTLKLQQPRLWKLPVLLGRLLHYSLSWWSTAIHVIIVILEVAERNSSAAEHPNHRLKSFVQELCRQSIDLSPAILSSMISLNISYFWLPIICPSYCSFLSLMLLKNSGDIFILLSSSVFVTFWIHAGIFSIHFWNACILFHASHLTSNIRIYTVELSEHSTLALIMRPADIPLSSR